jgi:hypothetical protein
VRIAEDVFSKPIGKVIGLTFALYCAIILVLGTREFVLAISISFLEKTPLVVTTGVFVILAAALFWRLRLHQPYSGQNRLVTGLLPCAHEISKPGLWCY